MMGRWKNNDESSGTPQHLTCHTSPSSCNVLSPSLEAGARERVPSRCTTLLLQVDDMRVAAAPSQSPQTLPPQAPAESWIDRREFIHSPVHCNHLTSNYLAGGEAKRRILTLHHSAFHQLLQLLQISCEWRNRDGVFTLLSCMKPQKRHQMHPTHQISH